MASFNILLGVCVLSLLLNFAIGNDDPQPPPNDEPQSRFFFPKITTTTCNYTTEPGLSCASCNQVLLCNRNNVGILKTCHFIKRFCNNGRCSIFPGPACDPTTTESASTTAAATTTEGTTTTNSDSTTTGGD